MITIYHNPRCSKSRQTLKLLQDSGKEFSVVAYLDLPLTKKQLKELCEKLDMNPQEITRTNEAIFKTLEKPTTDAQWLDAIAAHPILMQRPIVVKGDKATIGRPPENVLGFL